MKKAVILIDGQNLFYNLKSLNLKEREVNWSKLFNSFLEVGDELIRAYWFRPQRILDTNLTPEAIRNNIVYKNYSGSYPKYISKEHHLIKPDILDRIERDAKDVENWVSEQKARFASIEFAYDQLCLENSDIEIVKRGIVKVNAFKKEYVGEKGVDISLAVKLMSLSVEKKCDKIILVSGDYDYAEAIQYAKNNMTKIHIVKVHKGTPPKNRNMSRDLSVLADKIIDVYEENVKNNFLKIHDELVDPAAN